MDGRNVDEQPNLETTFSRHWDRPADEAIQWGFSGVMLQVLLGIYVNNLMTSIVIYNLISRWDTR